MSDLLQLLKGLPGCDQVYQAKYFKFLLVINFGEGLRITNIRKNSSIICLKDRAGKFFSESWYLQRKNNHEDEIKRLISTAAALIQQEIQNKV